MEVFSSAQITYSSGRNGVSWKRRPCQGLIASALSQRQIVVPEIEAAMPPERHTELTHELPVRHH
jgi:hypothetical protein